LLVVLDALVVSTALSSIRVDLDASVAQLEWTVNAYVLSFAVLLMTGAASATATGAGAYSCPAWQCLRRLRSRARWHRASAG